MYTAEPKKGYGVSGLFNKHTMVVVVVVKPADDGSYLVDTIAKKVSLLSLCLLAWTTTPI